MITFNTDGMLHQSFPFRAPIMDYIFKNVQPQHLVKLYQCSKYFFAKFRRNIIRNLVIVSDGHHETFHPTITFICASNPALPKLADFWITDSLIQQAIAFIPPFFECTVKELELTGPVLWKTFVLLTKAETVKELKLDYVFNGEKGGSASIEDIIAAVPNAISIEISESQITPTTFESLLSLNHKAKITNLVLKNMTSDRLYKKDLFIDFLFKNAVNNCYVYVDFKLLPKVNSLNRILNVVLELYGKTVCEVIACALREKEIKEKMENTVFL